MKIQKTYIIHYEPLRNRKKYLDEVIPTIHSNYEYFVSNEISDLLLENTIDEWYKYDSQILQRKLKISEIGVSVAHIKVYQDILKNDYELCLILEDDAILTEDFAKKIKIAESLAEKYDFIFLSTCCGLRSNIFYDEIVHPSEYSRCMTGYLINRKKIKTIIEGLIPLSTAIDNQLNLIKKKLDLDYGWIEPPIIIQGSETTYKSNLR